MQFPTGTGIYNSERKKHKMKISELMEKMIDFSEGDQHDICHFLKVWGYARTIGETEGLDPETQRILEAAAIVHDIACPLCRRKYGHADGKHQEIEGYPLAKEFLQGTGLGEQQIERVAWLVGHHHTLTGVEGMDYQILLEADYLVNAGEQNLSRKNIRNMYEKVFRTATGKRLLKSIYGI